MNYIHVPPMFFSDETSSMCLESEDFKGSAPPITFSQDDNEQLDCVAIDGRNLGQSVGVDITRYI